MENHNKAFGRALRAIRIERGLTQEALAFECGLDRTYISLLERGQRSPTLDTILALGESLGISLVQFAQHIESAMSGQTP